jgi:phosphoribosylformylglycinamidine cyclo-ligase
VKKIRTYEQAGVNIEAGNEFVRRIKPLVRRTYRPEVRSELGGFAGAFSLNPTKYRNPLLVSSTDGVGTKLKIAFLMDKHDTVGIDLVAMNVNDIVVMGAEPLFLLDYFACGKLSPDVAVKVIEGIVEGCRQAGCSLIGGETAEMPDFYPDGEYDLAGFTVGVVEDDRVIDGSTVTVGDRLIGLASTGLHSNGFSLARKIVFNQLGLTVHERVPEMGAGTVGEIMLTPTRIYVKQLLNLIRDVPIKGMAHITGGGLVDNVPRILPHRCKATVDVQSWKRPPVFKFLQTSAGVSDFEMYRTFNCGIGLVLVCAKDEEENVVSRLRGQSETVWTIGEITEREKGREAVEFVG